MGLRQLLSSNPAHLLEGCVGPLLKKVSPLFVEHDGAVRHWLYLLLKQVCETVDKATMAPFFPLLLASLKCGLTHINPAFQSDSITIVDLLILHYPNLVRGSIHGLLPLYIPLVAMKAAKKPSFKGKKKFGAVAMYVAKQPVLDQLLKFMSLMDDAETTPTCHAPLIKASEGKVWPKGDALSPPKDLKSYYTHSPFLLSVNPSIYGISPHAMMRGEGKRVVTPVSCDVTGFQNKLTNVLLELWIEIVSDSLFSSVPDSAHISTCPLLSTMIQLLCTVTTPTRCHDDKLLVHFPKHFVPYFPLYLNQSSPNQRMSSDVYMLNMFFARLILSVARCVALADSKRVANYLLVRLPQAPPTLSSQDLVKCVGVVIEILRCDMIPYVAELVYNSCHKFFVACHPLSSATLSLLAFLDRSTNQHMLRPLRHDNRQLYLDKFLFPCLSVLPVLLCGVSDSMEHCKLVLRVLKTAMACQISEVLDVFRAQLSQLFG